jgi:AraC-like DNA-binding protein
MESTTIELFGKPFIQCVTIKRDYRIPKTMENDACLAYVSNGTHEIFSPNQRIVARDSESILMKCGNYIATFKDVDPKVPFKNIVFHLDPESIKRAFGDNDLSFLKVVKKSHKGTQALKYDQDELLDSFVDSVMTYVNKPHLATEELLCVKLQELVYILSDSGNNPLAVEILGTLYSKEVVHFEEIVQANLFTNLTIPELAHLTSKSESSFKRDFNKIYGESPAKYLKTKRLEKAAELLKYSDLRINEIAWDCGFENAAHFSSSFSQYYGHSPRDYRNDLN